MTVNLHLGDCLEFMRSMPDKSVDAVITDPPYGINAGMMNLGYWQSSRLPKSDWDKKRPSKETIEKMIELSDVSIIWGGNYFELPPTRCFLIWDKGEGFKDRSFSECEMAWTNLDKPARVYKRDPLANGDYRERQHKTQKPLALMLWVIRNYTKEGDTIFDPFMGSGTTGVAAVQLGRKFIGCEINPDYYAIAEKRIKQAQESRQLELM